MGSRVRQGRRGIRFRAWQRHLGDSTARHGGCAAVVMQNAEWLPQWSVCMCMTRRVVRPGYHVSSYSYVHGEVAAAGPPTSSIAETSFTATEYEVQIRYQQRNPAILFSPVDAGPSARHPVPWPLSAPPRPGGDADPFPTILQDKRRILVRVRST